MYAIHSGYADKFINSIKAIYPNLLVIHHPYNGQPFSEYYTLSNGQKSIDVRFGCGGYYPDVAYYHVCASLWDDKFAHVTHKVCNSVVKTMDRGQRRYFPLKAKKKRLSKLALSEAYFILFGVKTKDKFEFELAVLHNGLDKYIESFDGKLWVRTIAV
jgi:hypothetical protein